MSVATEAARAADTVTEIFPPFDSSYILAFQFSSWFASFAPVSIKSTIIKPLGQPFKIYLESDGVYVPEGSENVVAESTLSDEEDNDESSEGSEPETQWFAFPELDARIRSVIEEYEAVFPKLNFSSPKDAAWILPQSSPLKCTSPADVYLLLKSSDFITHDISPERVFEGCIADDRPPYDLELVLRKWYPVNRSREIRCFVRNDTFLGISQRDTNFYDYMIDPDTQAKIKATVHQFWEEHIRPRWTRAQPDYVFDLLLTRDLSRGHILDFNPFAPRTDPLLFTYEDLHALLIQARNGSKAGLELPEIRVIDSPMHPAVTWNAPVHQHNMVPMEALSLSEGRSITEFSEILGDEVKRAMQEDDTD